MRLGNRGHPFLHLIGYHITDKMSPPGREHEVGSPPLNLSNTEGSWQAVGACGKAARTVSGGIFSATYCHHDHCTERPPFP